MQRASAAALAAVVLGGGCTHKSEAEELSNAALAREVATAARVNAPIQCTEAEGYAQQYGHEFNRACRVPGYARMLLHVSGQEWCFVVPRRQPLCR